MLNERDELDDEDLIACWRGAGTEGEREETYRLLFERHYGQVLRFFERRLEDQAEDLTQKVFLRVFEKLPAFRGDARFHTWLFRIAVNLFKNTLRERGAQKRAVHVVPLDPILDLAGPPVRETRGHGAHPLSHLLAGERRELLRGAIADMPAQMRRCVILRVDSELKYQEISEILRISIETVKAHLFQARLRLKRDLGDYFEDCDFE